MFPFTNTLADMVAVDHDTEVMRTKGLLASAQTACLALEAEEQRLIRLATDGNWRGSHADIEEAQRRLSVRKGTQTGWYLPEAQQARHEVQALRPPYQHAVAAAKTRLTQAGVARLTPLTHQLADLLREAQSLAMDIELLCQQIGERGSEKPEHPFPVLLPDGLVSWQLEKAEERKAQERVSAVVIPAS